MFTFGCAPVLDLDDARSFAQQFQLEEDRPTLRRIWFSVLMLPASLSDHRTILICSMRLYLLRMVINAVVLTL